MSSSTASLTSVAEVYNEQNTSLIITSPSSSLPNNNVYDTSYPGFDEESTVCCSVHSVDTNLENDIHKHLAESSDDDEPENDLNYQTLASITTSSPHLPLSEFIQGQVSKKILKTDTESVNEVPILLEQLLNVNSSMKCGDSSKIDSESTQKELVSERKHEWGNFLNQGSVPAFECSPFVPKDKKQKYAFQRTVVPPLESENS